VFPTIDSVLAAAPVAHDAGELLGTSREGRPVRGFRFGTGGRRISLLGGCHADEPVGPRLLSHLVAYLDSLSADDPLLDQHQWWIIPHINPDGEARNRVWYDGDDEVYDLGRYLAGVVRELPGDDIEFGFPRNEQDAGARPENMAAYQWWLSAEGPFTMHISLHGMGFAAGPWFLLEHMWNDRLETFKNTCSARVAELGYRLHDVERHGEKGFIRLGRGFCTRPDSKQMRQHFIDQGDEAMAARFRPSSMETIRSLGGDALTMVSEMPLFLLSGVGETLGPPDPVAVEWRERVERWRASVRDGVAPTIIKTEAHEAGMRPMPVRDQMALQWMMIRGGLQVRENIE
jgi:hypothetical protein